MQYGILIGRFQPLHKAHQAIIDEIMHDGRKPIIFIGSSNKLDDKNLFNYIERASMIHSIYGGDVVTLPLPDNESDVKWGEFLSTTFTNIRIKAKDCKAYYFYKKGDFDISAYIPYLEVKRPTYPQIYGLISASAIRANPQENKQYLHGNVLKVLEDKLLWKQ